MEANVIGGQGIVSKGLFGNIGIVRWLLGNISEFKKIVDLVKQIKAADLEGKLALIQSLLAKVVAIIGTYPAASAMTTVTAKIVVDIVDELESNGIDSEEAADAASYVSSLIA